MSVKMYAPFQGQAAQVRSSNGSPITVTNGYANVAEADVLSMLKQGWKIAGMPEVRRTTASNNANCTLVANAMAYGKRVITFFSGAAAITCTTETAANIIAELPNPKIFDTWLARVINLNSGNLTLSGGANVSFNGTAVVAANRFIDFMAQMDSNDTIIYYNVGFGNAT